MSQKLFSLSKKTKAIFLVIILMGIAIFVFQNARPNGGRTSLSPANPPVRPAYLNGVNLIGLSSKINSMLGTLQNIVINTGEVVLIDRDVDIGRLTIQAGGELHCPINLDPVTVKITSIIVNGKLQCGAIGAPYRGEMYFVLKHDGTSLPTNADFTAANASVNLKLQVPENYRAIKINAGGVVDFNGANDRTSWTKLSASANIGDSFILVDNGAGWRVGDTITIAPTGFNFAEFDQVQISGIMTDAKTGKLRVDFFPVLKYFHNGVTQLINVPASGTPANLPATNVNLDERAEVAVLNRHIIITSDISTLDPNNITLANAPYIGGHMMAMAGAMAYVDGVEFSQMGQMGVMGRYPFHWHNVGDATGQYIKNSSIHDTYQRCVTIHGTNNALVDHNLCYQHRGHGFFLEDGNEVGNIITNNLGMFSRRPVTGRNLLQSDINDSQAQRFLGPSTYWISNPQNTVNNNTASGYAGTGFWMAYCSRAACHNTSTYQVYLDTLSFNNNSAHSGAVGITWDGAPSNLNANNPRNPNDLVVDSTHYRPNKTPIFSNLFVFKNYFTGIYFRGQTAIYNNLKSADNGWHMFFAYNQIVRDSIIIGQSNNFSSLDADFLFWVRRALGENRRLAGIVMYDGPYELEKVRFLNFPRVPQTLIDPRNRANTGIEITPVPFDTIGGARKYSNAVRRLQFYPEPYRRILFSGVDISKRSIHYDSFSSMSLDDEDGSLSGTAGAKILADVPYNRSVLCSSLINAGGGVSSAIKCGTNLRPVKLGRFSFFGGINSTKIPFIGYRIATDGSVSSQFDMNFPNETQGLVDTDPNSFKSLLDNVLNPMTRNKNNKLGLLNDGSTYKILFRPEDLSDLNLSQGPNTLAVGYNAEHGIELSPIVQLSGRGSQCSLELPTTAPRGYDSRNIAVIKVNTLAELKLSQVSSYYSTNESFYFKIKTEVPNYSGVNTLGLMQLYSAEALTLLNNNSLTLQSKIIQTGSIGINYEIVCKSSVANVKGAIIANGPTSSLQGWACDYGNSNSIMVHFYAGGPAGSATGKILGSTVANVSSEIPVAVACGTNGHAYRFNYKIPANIRAANAGKQIYAYGISRSGKPNNQLLYSSANLPRVLP